MPLILPACVLSIKQITQGLGNMSTNITIYSPILINVSTNHDMRFNSAPSAQFCFLLLFSAYN